MGSSSIVVTKIMKNKNEKLLVEEMLLLIRKNPGMRPKELHQKLGIEHSWNLRSKLIKKGLVRKERDGAAVRYYPTKKNFVG